MWLRLLALILGSSFGLAVSVHAEPICITGGSVQNFGPPTFATTIALTGTDFSYTGFGAEWIPIHVCATFPCRAGSTETATEVFTEGDQAFAGGSGTFKGTSFRIPYPSEGSTVRLKFTASFSVPSLFPTEPTTGPLEWTITTPFTFAGIIDPINLDPISLTGHGILTLSASTDGFPPDHGLYIMQSARFDFLSMPEPSSLVLIVSGLAALAGWRLCRPAR